MSETRREKYYKRCQEIIDDLHAKVANGEVINDKECFIIYGNVDYKILKHELKMMGVSPDFRAMATAMEWLYHSQYFSNKAEEEKGSRRYHQSVYCSALAAMISAACSFVLCCKDCQGFHAKVNEEDGHNNIEETNTRIDGVKILGPTDKAFDFGNQIPNAINDHAYEEKDSTD